ncbi:MAG: DNA methyltransferase, partial [Patescibacteria group bacterium]|nr:DNA methyltransferase [Patescibacteria group bacterium]
LLNDTGSIFVRYDYKGNLIGRALMDEIFGRENFRNEIIINRTKAKQIVENKFVQQTESLFFYAKEENNFYKEIYKYKKEISEYEPYLPVEDKNYRDFRVINNKKFFSPYGRKWGIP